MAILEAGDGTLQKRLDSGRCPKCATKLPPVNDKGWVQCWVCKLQISGVKEMLNDTPV